MGCMVKAAAPLLLSSSFKEGIVEGHARIGGMIDEFQFKRIFQQPDCSWSCSGQGGGWLKFEQRAEQSPELRKDRIWWIFGWERAPILVLWLHFGLRMTVPCLEWSQGSCRLQAGVVTVLSVVMERSSRAGESAAESKHPSYPFFSIVSFQGE